jgi:hypothetical protein
MNSGKKLNETTVKRWFSLRKGRWWLILGLKKKIMPIELG